MDWAFIYYIYRMAIDPDDIHDWAAFENSQESGYETEYEIIEVHGSDSEQEE